MDTAGSSRPVAGTYCIVNRVLSPEGHKLAITFNGQGGTATVTQLSQSEAQHVGPNRALSEDVPWFDGKTVFEVDHRRFRQQDAVHHAHIRSKPPSRVGFGTCDGPSRASVCVDHPTDRLGIHVNRPGVSLSALKLADHSTPTQHPRWRSDRVLGRGPSQKRC